MKPITKKVIEFKKLILNLEGSERSTFFKDLNSYVYLYCEITEDKKRIPIYIGKGKSDRCLSHLSDLDDHSSIKTRKIRYLLNENKLGIDILAHGLNEKTALAIESACIDLMGIDNLENLVRGNGENHKRYSLNELMHIKTRESVEVRPEHRGVAILINKDYKPTFGALETFEITRGIWPQSQKTISKDAKYAYATFGGVVKEIYEIHSWVPAGTQQYFTVKHSKERLENCTCEFIGKIASDEIRDLYLEKILVRERSFGNTFIRVGN
tara:strand:- start:613 stop:1416 length:804 start_codon:yes stop_codon:yes gene_type:complete